MISTFWIVWCIEHGPPKNRHASFESAKREAERLANMHRGAEFVVLKTVGAAKRVDVQWEYAEDEVPS